MKVKDFLKEIEVETKNYQDYEIQIEMDYSEDPQTVVFEKDKKNKIFTITFGCCGL